MFILAATKVTSIHSFFGESLKSGSAWDQTVNLCLTFFIQRVQTFFVLFLRFDLFNKFMLIDAGLITKTLHAFMLIILN